MDIDTLTGIPSSITASDSPPPVRNYSDGRVAKVLLGDCGTMQPQPTISPTPKEVAGSHTVIATSESITTNAPETAETPRSRTGELFFTLFCHYPIVTSLFSELHGYELANIVRSSRKLRGIIQGTLGQGSIEVKTARWTCGGLGVQKFICPRCCRTYCRVCKFRLHPYSEGTR